MTAPFAASSVSLRLYPHLNGELDAPEIVAELTPVRGLAAAVDAAVRATAGDPGPSVRAAVASWPASPVWL